MIKDKQEVMRTDEVRLIDNDKDSVDKDYACNDLDAERNFLEADH